MAIKKTGSRRAMTVARLLRKAPRWRVDLAFFTRSSRISTDGLVWRVDKSIVISDSGLSSQLGLGVKPRASAARRLASGAWPALRDAIVAAGYEMFSDFAETTEFAHFQRPLNSIADARREWAYMNALRLGNAAKGLPLPARAIVLVRDRRTRAGVGHRLFGALRNDRALMKHLAMIRVVRTTRSRIADRRWIGRMAAMGDRSWLQTTIDFAAEPWKPKMTPATLDLLARIADPLVLRGYREIDYGMFGRYPLGPVSIRREMAYLSKLELADLLAPGVSLGPGEGLRRRDRNFYDLLGPERADVPCKRPDCSRGAIPQSVMCRAHHFEMIQERACPFDD